MTDDDSIREIPAEEAIAAVRQGRVWLLDVREPEEWRQGHVAEAHLIPRGEVVTRLGELPEDAPILVMCHAGARSAAVTRQLVASGYDAVNLAGGILAWGSAGGEIVPGSEGDARA